MAFSAEKWNESSIRLLINSGINFETLARRGISHSTFAEYFITSGLAMNRDLHWYGFHTDHDYAYLLRILSGDSLPFEEKAFFDVNSLFFPNFYDIKVVAEMQLGTFRGSLTALSDRLNVARDDNCEH